MSSSTSDQDPVRQGPTPAAPFGYVNLSDAVRAANESSPSEDPAPTESSATDPPTTGLASRLFSVVRYVHIAGRAIHEISTVIIRRHIKQRFRRNPDNIRHINSPAFTSQRVQSANVDDSQTLHLPMRCWLADATLAFTYQDFCGFCGSPMKNHLSTAAIIEGIVLSAASPGWEDNMGEAHRRLLILWEVITLGGCIACVVFTICTYVEMSSSFDGWVSSATISLAFYWLTFWQPRLGLLTIWGVLGRILCQVVTAWMAASSVFNWSTAFILLLLMFRVAVPQ